MPVIRDSLRLATVALLLCAVGCRKEDEICTYSVPKPEAVYDENHVERDAVSSLPAASPHAASPHGQPAGATTPERMIAAIVPEGESFWFFKTTGSVDAVGEAMGPFARLLGTLKFEDAQPSWQLPEGWTQKSGEGARFATLKFTVAEEPLEMSVIPLPQRGADLEASYVEDINRWRRQLGLKPTTREEIFDEDNPSEEVRKLELNGLTIVLVNLIGKSSAPSGGRQGPTSAAAGPTTTPRKTAASDSPFKLPPGWTPAKKDGFSAFAAEVTDGELSARITVSGLRGDGGGLEANINRWRRQVGLPSQKEAEIKTSLTSMSVGGRPGQYIELFGSADQSPRKAILGALVSGNDETWFIKFTGPAELATREMPNFKAFLKGLTFP